MVSVTHQLAEFAVNLTLDDIPVEVRARSTRARRVDDGVYCVTRAVTGSVRVWLRGFLVVTCACAV